MASTVGTLAHTRPAAPGGVASAARLALRVIATWDQRFRARRTLATLDPARCADIGLTPGAAAAEAAKPFWRD